MRPHHFTLGDPGTNGWTKQSGVLSTWGWSGTQAEATVSAADETRLTLDGVTSDEQIVETRARTVLSGVDDGIFGLVCNHVGVDQHYFFQARSTLGVLRTFLWNSGASELASKSFTFTPNTFYRMKVTSVNNGGNKDLEVFINGVSEQTSSTAVKFGSGLAGLYAGPRSASAQADFDWAAIDTVITISTITPNIIDTDGGQEIEVEGTDFPVDGAIVKIGGVAVDNLVVNSGISMTFNAPSGLSGGDHDLTIEFGTFGSEEYSATEVDGITVLDIMIVNKGNDNVFPNYTTIQLAMNNAPEGGEIRCTDSETYNERVACTDANGAADQAHFTVAPGESPTIGASNGYWRNSRTNTGLGEMIHTWTGDSPTNKATFRWGTADGGEQANSGFENTTIIVTDFMLDKSLLAGTARCFDLNQYPGDTFKFIRCHIDMNHQAVIGFDIDYFDEGARTVGFENCLIRNGHLAGIDFNHNGNADISDPTIEHCTFADFDSGASVAVKVNGSFDPTLQITNCLFTGNDDDLENEANMNLTTNGFEEHTPAGSNFAVVGNDEYVNNGVDFHLKTDADSIDAGTDLSFTEDIVGVSRPQGSDPDVGSYEFEDSIATASAASVLGGGIW